jgi:hypothetical protein
MEVLRVVVLDNRPIAGDKIHGLIVNQTLLLNEKYTRMARGVYKCSRLNPEAAYNLSSARTRGRLQL